MDHARLILSVIGAFSGLYFTLKELGRVGMFGKAIGNSVLYRDLRKLLVLNGETSSDSDLVVFCIKAHLDNPRSTCPVLTWERRPFKETKK